MLLIFCQEGRRFVALHAVVGLQLQLAELLFLVLDVAGVVGKVVVFATFLVDKHFEVADSAFFGVLDVLKEQAGSLAPP